MCRILYIIIFLLYILYIICVYVYTDTDSYVMYTEETNVSPPHVLYIIIIIMINHQMFIIWRHHVQAQQISRAYI